MPPQFGQEKVGSSSGEQEAALASSAANARRLMVRTAVPNVLWSDGMVWIVLERCVVVSAICKI